MKRSVLCLSVTIMMMLSVWVQAQVETVAVVPVQKEAPKPVVQLAILLDTSNSMDGLIDQAKAQLWSIVNEFIFAKRNGAAPEIQVALYEYGNDRLSKASGYIRQVLPFTTDLDQVSQSLFALTTNGGQEYCAWVIQDSVQALNWSTDPATLKTVFIAGNEPFTQGPVDYRSSCRTAIEKGILINTLHCGSEAKGREGSWHLGAQLADGRFVNIDQNQAIVHIVAPQDPKIAKLNERLNQTYVAYGAMGQKHQFMQMSEDTNAAQLSPEASVQRMVAKSSAHYRNSHWDLVDAVKQEDLDLNTLKEQQLPEEIRTLSPRKRQDYIEAKAKERSEIQEQIQELNQQRRTFVAQELKKRNTQDNSLGSAIIQAIRSQARDKGYHFELPQEKTGTESPLSGPK